MAKTGPFGLATDKSGKKDILGSEPILPLTGLESSNEESALRAFHSREPLAGITRHATIPNSYERVLGEGQYHPEFGNKYNEYLLSQKQSGLGQFGAFLNQAIVGEIIGGTIEGIGYLTDFKQYADIVKGTEEEWGNSLSDLGRSLKTWTREATPVFIDPSQAKFAPNRWSWWMSNAPSIASTLSLLIPAMGVVKGISAAGKAAKIGFGSKGFLKAVDNIAAKAGPAAATKFAQGSELFATGVGQAVVSRHMENLMEASQIYEEVLENGGSKEDAAKAASNTYNKQWLLLAQDIPQYLLFNKMIGKGASLQKSKSMASFLGYDANKVFANKGVSVLKTMLGEAGEEGYQFLVNEQSKLIAESGSDPAMKHSLLDVLNDNYDNGELYTSMFFGALGAGAMLGSAKLISGKGEQKAAEAQVKDLVQTGKEYNAAYQTYVQAQEEGDPISQSMAWNNMVASVGLSSVLHKNTENTKEIFRQLADPNNNEAFEKLGVTEQAGGLLQQNPELAEQLEKDIDRIEYLYNRYTREVNNNKDIKSQKEKNERARLLTVNKFLLDKTKEQLDVSNSRLEEIKNGTEDFFNITPTGQAIAIANFKRHGLTKPISFLEKQLKRDDLGDKQRADYNLLLEFRKLEDQRLKQDIAELRKEYTKEEKAKDDKIKKGLDLNQVDEYVSEYSRNRYIQSSIEQLEAHEEKYRTGEPLSSKEEQEDHVEATERDAFDEDNHINVDDVVSFENEDGTRSIGKVDSVVLATEDTEGNEITPSGDNADNIYNIVLLNEDGTTSDNILEVRQRHLNVEDKRKYIEDQDNVIDPLSEQEETLSGLYNAKEANESRGSTSPISNLSYSNVSDDNTRLIEVRNENLNKVLSDPETDLSKATAEYYIDLNDDFTKSQLSKLKKVSPEISKAISRLQSGKHTAADIDLLTKITTGTRFGDIADILKISVKINIGSKTYSKGLALHRSDFPYMSIPARVIKEQRTDSGAINKYKEKKFKEARETRTILLKQILDGKTPISKGLKVGRGAPVTERGTKNNVASVLGTDPNKVKLGIVKSGITETYVGELHVGENSVHSGTNYSSPGAIFAITDKTINGAPYSLKLNREKIDEERASILFEAFRILGISSMPTKKRAYTPGGRYYANFTEKDTRVEGLSVGQVVDLLVVHGKERTDPNSTNFKKRDRNKRHLEALANKRLYLDTNITTRKVYLVYGNNPITGEGYRIDLSNFTEGDRTAFVKWATTYKNYANHLSSKKLDLELNSDFLKGKSFRIGTKNPMTRKTGENYNAFLINNKIITTDAKVNPDTGLIFHAPTLDLGLYNSKGEISVRTTNKQSVLPETKQTKPVKKKEKKEPKQGLKKRVTKPVVKTKDGIKITTYETTREDGRKLSRPHRKTTLVEFAEEFNLSDPAKEYLTQVEENHGEIKEIRINEIREDKEGKVGIDVTVVVDNGLLEATVSATAIPKEIKPNLAVSVREASVQELEDAGIETTYAESDEEIETLKAEGWEDIGETNEEGLPVFSRQKIKEEEIEDEPNLPEGEELPSFDDLMDDFQGDIDDFFTKPFKREGYKVQNLEKELKWLAQKLGISDRIDPKTGKQNLKIVKDLSELIRKGKNNFGLFTRDAILIYEAAEEGTIYHEAFHRVSQGYLSDEERKSLYRAARAFYKRPKATDREIEELLAEGFREYVINREEDRQVNVLTKIADFFRNLYEIIRAFFVGDKKLTNLEVEQLFKEIYRGRFRFSKMTKENIKRIGNDFYTKGVGGRDFETIVTRQQINSIVKTLANRLLRSNDINDLNNVKNIEWKPLFDSIATMLKTMEKQLEQKDLSVEKRTQIDRAKDIYTEVFEDMKLDNKKGDRSVFLDRVRSYLRDVGITNRIRDLEESDDLNDDLEVVGSFDLDKRSSWEVSTKDNAMTSVKFMVGMLPKFKENDPVTGFREYVDFNTTWHRLLERIHKYDTIKDMIDELYEVGSETEEGYAYTKLAHLLETKASEDVKAQFLTTFRTHRHDFITYMFRGNTKKGTNISITNTSLDQLYRDNANAWNELFYLDSDIINTDKEGKKTFNKDFFEKIYTKYLDIADDIKIAQEEGDTTYDTESKIVQGIIDVLSDLHIFVDENTIYQFINNKGGDNSLQKIDTAITDLRSILEGDFLSAARSGEQLPWVPGMFLKNPVITELSKIYVEQHPEQRSDVVLGAGNNKYFVYANNNMLTDIVRKIQNRDGYVKDKIDKIGNRGSLILEQLLDPSKRDNFGILTFSKLASTRGRDSGRDYIGITRLEDYLVKFTTIMNGYLTLPILADRKQYYNIKGIEGYKNVIKESVQDENGNYIYRFSDQVLDRFYKYYLDEKDRIKEAKKLRKEYLEAKGKEKARLEKRLIKNYHYTGNLNVKSKKANAYNFIHFKGFKEKAPASEIKEKINSLLSEYVNEEIQYAAQIDIITKQGNDLETRTLANSYIEESEIELGTSEAIRRLFGDFVVGNMVSIIESEKVFFADPAFFKQNKEGGDVTEDMYKRWFGPGSTGQNLAESIESYPDESFNVVTLNTQTFKTDYYDTLHEKQAELYERILKEKPSNKDKSAEDITKEAEHLATLALSAYENVDPTDGQAFISNDMYRSISKRLGQWGKEDGEKEQAYQLLISDKELTASEELQALNVVLQPLKLVYIGKENDGNLDTVVYDKMSMATLFRRQVAGTHLEALVDKMEDPVNPVHMFKFDTATKIGGRPGVDFFKDAQKRDEVVEWGDLPIYKQYFENLKFQVVTDTHDVTQQTVGTQMFKIAMMNINKKIQYGEYENGEDLLNAITKSRAEVSNIGAQEIKALFGFKNGSISDEVLITMLREDAEQAGRSDDFQQSLKLDERGKQYLQLDSFSDRRWVYARIVSIIGKHTVDLNMPGNQLIQVSDYGRTKKKLDKELGFISSKRGDTQVYEMEARVSINLFKHLIPNELISFEQKKKFISDKLKVIGYRIPTQGQNSIVRLKIVDVLDSQAGDVIHLPLEFTALTGSDFDIDKLFVISYNYKKGKVGEELQKIPFLEGDETFEERYKEKKKEYENIHKGQQIFMDKESFGKLTIEEQNTKKANQNRILDAFYTVLGHEEHFLETTTPLGRLTGKLKKKAEQYEKLARGGTVQSLKPLESTTPKYQSATKFIFTGSKTGIGPFALANANHALTQQAEIQFKTGLEFGFNSNNILNFDRFRGEDDISISDWLSALIDAHVDAVKDPYIIKLNVNESTYDVVNFLLRIGVGEDTFAFLSQPVIKEYAQEYFNAKGRITATGEVSSNPEQPAFNFILRRWLTEYGLDEEELLDFNFTKSDIEKIPLPKVLNKIQLTKDISSKQARDREFLTRQINILHHFMDILEESKDLTRLTMISRIDTKKYGTTPTELMNFLNQLKTVESSGKWINLEKLVRSDGVLEEGGTMLSPLLKNSVLLALDLLSSKSIYSSQGFSTIFWELLNSLPNSSTAYKSTINNLTEELFSYFVGQFFADPVDGFGMSDPRKLRTILKGANKSVFTELYRIKSGKHKYSAELKENKLINALIVDNSEDSPHPTYLKLPFRTLKDKWETDDYIDDFRELFTHEDKSIRDFARRLFIYSFYTSGFRNRYYSFHNYIPLDVFKELEVVDSKGNRKVVSFDNYIKKLLVELNEYSSFNTHLVKAKREVFTNNWFDNNIVPSITADSIFETYEKDGEEVGFALSMEKQTRFVLGVNNEEQKIYVPYLTMEYYGNTVLMEYAGITKGKAVYRIVRKKGFQHRGIILKEYGVESDRSVVDPLTTKAEEENRDYLANLPEEQKRNPFNWIYTVGEEEFANIVTSKGNIFKRIPFNNQFVTDVAPSQNSFNMDFRGGTGEEITEGLVKVDKSKSWGELKDLPVYSPAGVMVMRKQGTNEHFGNPFTDSGVKGLIQMSSTNEASQAYRDWLDGINYTEIKPKQRQWILSQIDQGRLDNQTLLYMNKNKGRYYSHADALAEFINERRAGVTKEVENQTTTEESLSTPKNRIEIFADGSATRDRNYKLTDYGYGATFTWNDEVYRISGNKERVNEIMKSFITEGAELGDFSNPTTELLATYNALKQFENTREHVTILQDFEGAINYGDLWYRSVGSENRTNKPKTPSAPHIKFVVELIMNSISKIERNGGSVKLKWVPSNHGSFDRKVAKNPKTFMDENGNISTRIVTKYANGNTLADSLAKNQKNINTFGLLKTPIVQGSTNNLFTEDEQKQGEDTKNNCKNN